MKISELIEKWEKEIDLSYIKSLNNNDDDKWYYTGRCDAISSILEDIKNLNGKTVKRSELIDFTESLWHSCNLKGDGDNIPELVDYYLKSINE